MSEIQLRVADAKQRDVGRGIARIDQKAMAKLGITAGDVIEIQGKKITSAIAWPAYAEDQGLDIIRIDGITRRNANVALNEYVKVRKAQVKDAISVRLAPANMRLDRVDESFVNFVKSRLMERTFVEGDTIMVSVLGRPMP
ncbi:MAG: AAA family ATPase, partial [Thermoprotei archaeon]